MTYVPGDFWRICDVCGFKKRASQTRKRWDNLIVCDADWEPRHPQDFVRGRKDRQTVPDPRPEGADTFLGPLCTTTTAAAVAGATTLNVESSVRMTGGDRVGVMLASGEIHRAVIQTVPTAASITLSVATKLPGAVVSGAQVIDYSAVSSPNLG